MLRELPGMPIDQGNGYHGQNSGIVPLIIRLPFEVVCI